MGSFYAVGAISKCAAPFWAVESMKVGLSLMWSITGGLFLIATVLLVVFWEKCEPHVELDWANRISFGKKS